jgi:hypothetical protein
VILRDPNNNEFEVHVIKMSKKLYFDDGWFGLKDFYDIPFGAWVTFTYLDPKNLAIKLATRWGEEVKYPTCKPPLRCMLTRAGFDIVDGSFGPLAPSSCCVPSRSFVCTFVKKMTCNDIHSGTLVFNLFYHLLSMTYCVFILLGLILLILFNHLYTGFTLVWVW